MDSNYMGAKRLSREEKEALKKRMRFSWVIWAAMIISLWVYVYVAHVVGDEIREDIGESVPIEMFKNILFAVVLAEFVLIHFIRKLILTAPSKSGERKSSVLDALKPLILGPSFSSIGKPFPPGRHQAVSKYATAMVVSLAIAESIGIYGLILYFLGSDLQTMYMFMAFSALTMVIYRPKYEELERLALAMRD